MVTVTAGASLAAIGMLALVDAYNALNDVERNRLARFYDKNSTRQILKQTNLALYAEKKAEFTDIASRFRTLALRADIDDQAVAELVGRLRASPFYDADIHQPALKNLFAAGIVDGNHVPASYLDPQSHCLVGKADKVKKYACSKRELLLDMYLALGLEGEKWQ